MHERGRYIGVVQVGPVGRLVDVSDVIGLLPDHGRHSVRRHPR
jgi:hypothetical protein